MSKEEKKALCPFCNGQLKLGLTEHIFHQRVIDSDTGKLKRKTEKAHISNSDTRTFISCEHSTTCDFFIDSDDSEINGEYFYLFDMIDQDDQNKFSKKVLG